MGSAKPIVVLCAVFCLAAFVPLLQAVDPRCVGLPNGEIFLFPHEYNCSLYYQCSDGVETVLSCPSGLYFNEDGQNCDFPEISGCTNGSPGDCAGVDLDYLPYPADCSNYIECYDGESYLMECPDDYYFDSSSKMCVRPWESDCFSQTTPNAICNGVRPGDTHLYSYPDDCHLYYRCSGATLTVESCSPYFYFDEDRQLCDFPETVDCDGGTRTADPSTSTALPSTSTPDHDDPRCQDGAVSYWPHPVFCELYIECYGGSSYEVSCPPGLYFSDSEKHCVNPSESGCNQGGTTTPRVTVTFPTDWTSDPDCPYPEGEGWLFPYPGDCTKFYECAEGKKVMMQCPDKLWFSVLVNRCDYPYQTPCNSTTLSFLDRIKRVFL